MEQEPILFTGNTAGNGLSSDLDTKALIERLSVHEQKRRRGDHDLNPGMEPSDPLRPAAVLVPLIDHGDIINVLLTQRTDHLHHHAGQISFPGGRLEKEDGNPENFDAFVAAALRETHEEIGLSPNNIAIIGRLDDYITRTGFKVIPVVAIVRPPLALNLDDFEVAEAFEVPLPFLMNESNHRRETRQFNGRDAHFFAMPYESRFIWGATAGMLRNLFDVLADPDYSPRLRP